MVVNFTCDGAMDLGTVLQLDGHRLVAQFHQKPVESGGEGVITHQSFDLQPNFNHFEAKQRPQRHLMRKQTMESRC